MAVLLHASRLQLGHRRNGWHVWGIVHLVLNLQVVKTLPLVQGVRVRGPASLLTRQDHTLVGIWRRLLRRAIVARVWLICLVVVIVVDKPLFLKEISAAGFRSLVDLVGVLLLEGVVLDIDLALVVNLGASALHLLLDHADESEKLTAFDLFWVEVEGFSYIEVGNHVVG